jgi:hypothetical protein
VNGLLAAIFWTSAVINPQASIIDSISAKPSEVFTSTGLALLEYQKEIIGTEIQFDFGHKFTNGPLQRITSVSLTDQLGTWVGHGFYNEIEIPNNFSFGFSFLPGLYHQVDEVDLGGWIMFRSGVQLNYDFSEEFSISFCYDHRSSGDIWDFNPGLETWQIKFRSYI